MECERCNRQLSQLVDGRLSGRSERRLRLHIAGCRRCREDLDELRKVRALLRHLPSPEPLPQFWSDTMDRVRQSTRRHKQYRRPAGPLRYGLGLGAAAIAAAVIAFAYLQVRHNQITGPTITLDPAVLVSMHAVGRAQQPLADAGEVRYAIGEADDRNLADDSTLDAN